MASIAQSAPAARVTRIEEGLARRQEAHSTRPHPVACMTGLAKEIIPAIQDAAMSQKAKSLMTRIVAAAMGNAGWETEHPEEAGLWCDMDTAAWAAGVKCSRQYIAYLTEQLVGYHLISRHPSPDGHGLASCRLRINPNLNEWEPLQAGAHTRRYAKPGAGRPPKKTTERNESDSIFEAGLCSQSDSLRSVGEIESGSLRQLGKNEISFVTLGSFENPVGETRAAPVRKITKEEITEERTKRAPASAAAPLASGLPPMPSSGPRGPTAEELLELLHGSAGWKADRGKDLLLLRSLQHYPLEWLYERATDYVFAEGQHSYQGFKNWCQSSRAQEKLRLWEQAQRARALRAAPAPASLLSRQEQEEEEVRIVAERNARSRARFGPSTSHD